MSAPPAPSARVRAQAEYEARTLLTNGEQLLVSMILPALALFGLTWASVPDLQHSPRIGVVAPSVLALALVSTAFTGQAIATGFDRRYGVLRFLGTTPLGRTGLLWGKAVAVLIVALVQTVVLGGLSLVLGWSFSPAALPLAVLVLTVGAWTWVALAMLLAGTLRAEGVLAVANLVWVLAAGVGGLLLPRTLLPGVLPEIVRWLPSAAVGDGLRSAFLEPGAVWIPLLILVAWGALATALTARTFSWSDR